MKVPKARKLSSGKYFIQLRIGGESVSISDWDEKKCTREAQRVKAEYLAGKRLPPPEPEPEKPKGPTLTETFDLFLAQRQNVLSPTTIRGYRAIQKHRFGALMPRHVEDIPDEEWQPAVNELAEKYSPKTVENAYTCVRTIVGAVTGRRLPDVTVPAPVAAERAFLLPDEIKLFVAAVKDTKYAVPALLALSSCRMSEIHGLMWEHIPKKPDFIRINGSIVRNEKNEFIRKKQNKNISSSRNIPIMIPELKDALERDRQPAGPVMTTNENNLRLAVHRICMESGITDVTVHGLRHSFASLAYHLQIPERIAMEIGGWNNPATMHKIYTHIAQADIRRYQTAMADFYSGAAQTEKNANENANKK